MMVNTPMTGLPDPGRTTWVTGLAAAPPGRWVRVLIPPALARPHSADLLLCGHHYRASGAALAAAGAVIINDRRSGRTIITEYELRSVPSDATPRR